ncbi:hypothetical protein P152DRAFT_48217 [Eremomyces bilateralis CBS 781.70]|uniref:Uncharacterized protein n=1 Tax=Eremomyces bilateralis CBS 781.70 TaxID=1392243 RepID=A0A6G1G0N0_9PEZI|nr:uncharacterized protein P152DRAFT_48217 [Eremomyces bilateralis CBS 781.70]KAF1811667.1 hypothetical protein P152DRAFT_48217 [Eremomyces bilateralis CBS 781.70]
MYSNPSSQTSAPYAPINPNRPLHRRTSLPLPLPTVYIVSVLGPIITSFFSKTFTKQCSKCKSSYHSAGTTCDTPATCDMSEVGTLRVEGDGISRHRRSYSRTAPGAQ